MKRKSLKLLSIILSSSMFFCDISHISAYELDENQNSIENVEYQNNEDENFTNAANVFAEIGSIYKVTIPKTIVLSGETKEANYYVKTEGDIAGDEQIVIQPDKVFYLSSINKNNVLANISQDKTIWKCSNLNVKANGTISASSITAGKWIGVFNFNIDLNKVAGDLILPINEDAKINISLETGDITKIVLQNIEDFKNPIFSSSNPDVITVDENGNIKAVGTGVATILVEAEDGTTREIEVKVEPSDSVLINASSGSLTLPQGNSKKLNLSSITGKDVKNATITSSNPEVAYVDKDGNIISVSEGTTTITITTPDGFTKEIIVNVPKTETISVTVDKGGKISATIEEGNTKRLELASVTGLNLTGATFTSNNPEIATIDENGNIKALKEGVVTITITLPDGTTKDITVNVKPAKALDVAIDKTESEIIITAGSSTNLNISSTNGTLKNPIFTSSNEEVAIIDQDGNVIAKNVGTTTITIKSDNSTDKQVAITVEKADNIVPTIENEDVDNIRFIPGQTEKINIISNNSMELKNVTFESSNPNVVTVDNNGNVKAVGKGTATITIKSDNSVDKTITITVDDKDYITSSMTDGKVLFVSIEDGSVKTINLDENKDLTYKSSNVNVATVDSNGNIVPKNVGKTVITVKDENGNVKDIIVNVEKTDNIVVNTENGETNEFTINDSYPLNLISSNTMTIKNPTFKSDNENIVKVDKDGTVKPVGEGTAIITIESDNSLPKTVVVTVTHKAGEAVTENKVSPTCTKDETYQLVEYCKYCGVELSRVNKTGASKLGHNYVEGTCTRCGDVLPAFSVSASGFTGNYDGKAHGITVTSSGNTIQYSTDNKTWTATNPTFTNAGTYTVYYKVSKAQYKTVTGSQTVKINKINPTLTAPTGKSLIYTGSAQTLVNAGSTNAGTLQYSTDNKTWITTVPTATNAGTYTIYYRVVGNTNYNDITAKSVTSTITEPVAYYTISWDSHIASCTITHNGVTRSVAKGSKQNIYRNDVVAFTYGSYTYANGYVATKAYWGLNKASNLGYFKTFTITAPSTITNGTTGSISTTFWRWSGDDCIVMSTNTSGSLTWTH